MSLYQLDSTLILPFRSWLPPRETSDRFWDDAWDSKIKITYQEFFDGPRIINTTLCTITHVSTFMKIQGDEQSVKSWARNNAAAIVADTILPRLNYYFLKLKRAYPKAILTGCLRNFGDSDLIYSTLLLQGEVILTRGSPTFPGGLGIPPPSFLIEGRERPDGPVVVNPNSPGPISKEWTAITRAVDLVNHGYFSEALLVGFALLDAMAQDFVKDRIPNLGKEDARWLLRNMRGQRLETFLGPLLRVCINASPLDDKKMKSEIAWLNNKRNAIIHSGEQCLRGEAQRGLRTILQILGYLSEKGANYFLPQSLEFYTPPTADLPIS